MTLDEFIADSLQRFKGTHLRAHVIEPRFSTLYVRWGRRTVDGTVHYPVLDIATVTVAEKQRGRGVFTDLLDRIRDQHPTLHLFVENAIEERFQKHLERYGFVVREPRTDPPCYFLPART
jgi:hypothetical protein